MTLYSMERTCIEGRLNMTAKANQAVVCGSTFYELLGRELNDHQLVVI
jgi:hypothetical protein